MQGLGFGIGTGKMKGAYGDGHVGEGGGEGGGDAPALCWQRLMETWHGDEHIHSGFSRLGYRGPNKDPQARFREHPEGLQRLQIPLPWRGEEGNEVWSEREMDADDVSGEGRGYGDGTDGGRGGAVDGL